MKRGNRREKNGNFEEDKEARGYEREEEAAMIVQKLREKT